VKVAHFLSSVEHTHVHEAIRAAEEGNSGDIVVYITRRKVADALAEANKEFDKLHLQQAVDHNSFLILLAPRSQTFAVIGGTALHEKVGQSWWDSLIELLTHHFKAGRYTEGLVAAIERAGVALKTHFPAEKIDRAGQSDIVEE
jgi:uncharacterized membrane protein